MRLIYACVLLSTFMLVTASAAASGVSPHSYGLPDHGALTLLIPDGWTSEFKHPPNRLPPTIGLMPRSGMPFAVLITAGWPTGPLSEAPDEATIRSEIAAAARGVASQSVEGVLPLVEIKGVNGGGFYFAATDRAPNPGEYKHLTQGVIRVGEITLAFTVLTNDGQEAEVTSVLVMLRTAEHRGSNSV
ncbi:MAG: hypothetical protein ABSD02_12670 [Steroidobacteraceae bacterium]